MLSVFCVHYSVVSSLMALPHSQTLLQACTASSPIWDSTRCQRKHPHISFLWKSSIPRESSNIQPPMTNLSMTSCWHKTISPVASHLPAHSRLLELCSDICGCVTISCQKSQCPLHGCVLSLVLGAENSSNISAVCRSPPCQSNSCLCLSKVYFTAL